MMWSRFRQKMVPCVTCPRSLVYMYVLLMLSADLLVPIHAWKHTWTPNDVVDAQDVSNKQTFAGDGEMDYFKVLDQQGQFLLVGGMNKVYNISMETLQHDHKRLLEWKPSSIDVKNCLSTLPNEKNKCQNFIKVLGKMSNGQLYVCGTNAYNPTCRTYEYKEEDLPRQVAEYTSIQEESGRGKCPYDPNHNSTSIYADGNLYSGTVSDYMGQDPVIMKDAARPVSTNLHDKKTLYNPDFISSFEIDDKIYFFLRETSVENINCRKITVSRIARVCKKDLGGAIEETWTSYFKARLICSNPGLKPDVPFYFDELQSISNFDKGNYMPTSESGNRTRMFYGIFNTPENSIQGSAICGFTYNDIQKAFHSKFASQKDASHNWQPVAEKDTPQPHPADLCVDDSLKIPQETAEFTKKHPLMNSPVDAVGGRPVMVQTTSAGGRFTAVAIDWQHLASDRHFYDIIYVGTDDGRVLKSINAGEDGNIKNIVIEDIQVLGKEEAVTDLKIYGHSEKLIVISKGNIVSIPLYRCEKHTTCGDCVALQDPHCAWQENKCISRTSRGLQSIKTGDTSICPDGGKRAEIEEVTTTPAPVVPEEEEYVEVVCPVCNCNCNQSKSSTDINIDGTRETEKSEDKSNIAPSTDDKPCAPKYIAVRTDDQVFTASTLAIACVIAVIVSVLIGFVIGYRVSLCRNNTRNTEQMINYEQHFGSLRKNPNRHSIEASHNYYSDPNKPYKIQNVLVTNNIPSKNPNLPNGVGESKTIPSKTAAKTYL